MFRRLADLLAANIPAVRDYMVSREVDAAYKRAVAAVEPEERVHWSTKTLDILATVQMPGSQYWEGVLYNMRGQGYMELRPRSNAHYSRLAHQDFERAAALLRPESGKVWGNLMNWLSISHAESFDGDRATAIDEAIRCAEEARAAFTWKSDPAERAEVQVNLAGYHLQRGQHGNVDDQRKAIGLLEDVLANTADAKYRRQGVIAQAALSSAYRELKEGNPEENIERAIQLAESAMPDFERLMRQVEVAGFLMNLAGCYRDRPKEDPLPNREKAKALYRKSIDLLAAPEFKAQKATAEMNLAGLLRSAGEDASAISLLESAASVFTPEDHPEQYAMVHINLSQAREPRRSGSRRQSVEQAIADARTATESTSRRSDPILWASARLALANALSLRRGENRQRDLEEAIILIQQAIECLPIETHLEDWCIAKTNLANALADRVVGLRRKNLEASIAIQIEVLEKTDPRLSPTGWAHCHRNLAHSYLERTIGSRADNVEKAIAHVELGLVVLKPYAHTLQRADALETLGDALSRRTRGNPRANAEDACQAYDAAWRDRDRNSDPEGWLRLRQKRINAISTFQATHPQVPVTAENEPDADTASDRMSTQDFIDQLQEASGAVTFEDHPYTWSRVQEDLALTLMSTVEPGEPSEESLVVRQQPRIKNALEIYEKILVHFPPTIDPEHWAHVRALMGNAYSMLHLMEDFHHRGFEGLKDRSNPELPNRSPVAMSYLDAATVAYGDAATVFQSAERPRDHLDLCLKLGEAHLWRRDWKSATEAFEAAGDSATRLLERIEVSETEFRSLLRSLGDLSNDGPFAAAMSGDNQKAVRLFELGRARILVKSLALAAAYAAEDLRIEAHAIQAEIRKHEDRLSQGNLFERSTPLEASIRLRGRLARILGHVGLDKFVNNIDGYARLTEITGQGVLTVLPLFTAQGGCLLIAESRDSKLELTREPSADEILLKEIYDGNERAGFPSWIQGYRAVDHPNVSLGEFCKWGQTLSSTAAHLSAFALNALFRHRGHGDAPRRLNLLPQSAVGLLPIVACPAADDSAAMLIDSFAVSMCPSLSTLAHARQRAAMGRKATSITAVSNTARGIPSTVFEAQFAESWFATKGLVNSGSAANFTRDELFASLRETEVWHFACHGHFDSGRPTQSGLELGSGFLTLEDLLQTELLGSPELVVLSACSTGLYSMEELPNEFFGLASGFLQLGARSVVASLWPAWDTSTAILISYFYEKCFQNGFDTCCALRDAQVWLRDASVRDILHRLIRWRESGRVDEPAATRLIKAFQADVKEMRPLNERPYSSPAFWAPFVHFGA